MDVGVVVLVDAAEHVDHLPRPLRAGGVVEEDERVIAVDELREDREVVAQAWQAATLTAIDRDRLCPWRRSVFNSCWSPCRFYLASYSGCAVHRRVDGRLQHLPREQATLLAVRGQPGAVEFEHVFGGELLGLVDRLALHFFEQHRGRGLADDAAVAGEIGVADFAVGGRAAARSARRRRRAGCCLRGRAWRSAGAHDGTGPRNGRGCAPGRVLLRRWALWRAA